MKQKNQINRTSVVNSILYFRQGQNLNPFFSPIVRNCIFSVLHTKREQTQIFISFQNYTLQQISDSCVFVFFIFLNSLLFPFDADNGAHISTGEEKGEKEKKVVLQ